jgi:hypothetical protein
VAGAGKLANGPLSKLLLTSACALADGSLPPQALVVAAHVKDTVALGLWFSKSISGTCEFRGFFNRVVLVWGWMTQMTIVFIARS